MLRGRIKFICEDCGRAFVGLDIEWQATAFSQPMKCPNCDSYHTRPLSLLGLNKFIYRSIWKQMDGCN